MGVRDERNMSDSVFFTLVQSFRYQCTTKSISRGEKISYAQYAYNTKNLERPNTDVERLNS